MKFLVPSVILTMLAGVFASTLLIAPDTLRAHMFFRDQDYGGSIALYSKAYQAGDRSPEIELPLVKSYLLTGQAQSAVTILEELHGRNPKNRMFTSLLLPIYNATVNLDGIERLLHQQDSQEALLSLADFYRQRRNRDAEREILQRLEQIGATNGRALTRLAFLECQARRYNEALRILGVVSEKYTSDYDSEAFNLELAALSRAGITDRDERIALAVSRAQKLTRQISFDPGEIVWKVLNFGHPRAAMLVIENIQPGAQVSPPLIEAYVRAGRELNQHDRISQFLKEAYRRELLDHDAMQIFVRELSTNYEGAMFLLGENDTGRLSLPESWLRNIGFQALNQWHEVRLAERIFIRLANAGSRDNPDVKMLMHIWGPRPGSSGLAWIASQARTASGGERALWLGDLLRLGGGPMVAKIIEDRKWQGDGEIDRVYQKALVGQGKIGELKLAVTRSAETAQDADVALQGVSSILQMRRYEDALELLNKLDQRGASTPQVLLLGGLVSYERGRFADSNRYLRKLFVNGADTPLDSTAKPLEKFQAYYFRAELLRRDDREDLARPYYRNALQQLERLGGKYPQRDYYRAEIVRRLDGEREAIRIMNPRAESNRIGTGERVLLADMLIDQGDLEGAHKYLFPIEVKSPREKI